MGLTREERKLLHQKGNQPTFGRGRPDNREGMEGDVAYRKVQGVGLSQYVKQDGIWVLLSSESN